MPVPDGSLPTSPPATGRVAEEILTLAAAVSGGWAVTFTPRSVVRMAVRLTDPAGGDRVHDPFCRAGEFLVGAADYVGSKSAGAAKPAVSGQEASPVLGWLAAMNLLLHGITADRVVADRALSCMGQPDTPSDVILLNPPFNLRNWRDEGDGER